MHEQTTPSQNDAAGVVFPLIADSQNYQPHTIDMVADGADACFGDALRGEVTLDGHGALAGEFEIIFPFAFGDGV